MNIGNFYDAINSLPLTKNLLLECAGAIGVALGGFIWYRFTRRVKILTGNTPGINDWSVNCQKGRLNFDGVGPFKVEHDGVICRITIGEE